MLNCFCLGQNMMKLLVFTSGRRSASTNAPSKLLPVVGGCAARFRHFPSHLQSVCVQWSSTTSGIVSDADNFFALASTPSLEDEIGCQPTNVKVNSWEEANLCSSQDLFDPVPILYTIILSTTPTQVRIIEAVVPLTRNPAIVGVTANLPHLDPHVCDTIYQSLCYLKVLKALFNSL